MIISSLWDIMSSRHSQPPHARVLHLMDQHSLGSGCDGCERSEEPGLGRLLGGVGAYLPAPRRGTREEGATGAAREVRGVSSLLEEKFPNLYEQKMVSRIQKKKKKLCK